jgi:hypothetical protein
VPRGKANGTKHCRPHLQGQPCLVVRPCLARVARWSQFLRKCVSAYENHNTTRGTLLVLKMCMKLVIYTPPEPEVLTVKSLLYGPSKPHTRSNCPLQAGSFRVVSVAVCVCRSHGCMWCLFLGPVALQWLRGSGKRKVVCGTCDFGYPTKFILLGKSSLSRRIFIGCHSLPPL